jgi:hypothetical protein
MLPSDQGALTVKLDLHPVRFGLILSVFSIFLGFTLGGLFGINEDAMKARLKASAEAVREQAYKGDGEAIKKTLDKSWVYVQRSHLHYGAIGTAALALCLLLAFLDIRTSLKKAASILLGLGAVGYGTFWLLAAFKAPGLGGTGAAKESLQWLGMPSAAMCLIGVAMVLGCLIGNVITTGRSHPPSDPGLP